MHLWRQERFSQTNLRFRHVLSTSLKNQLKPCFFQSGTILGPKNDFKNAISFEEEKLQLHKDGEHIGV